MILERHQLLELDSLLSTLLSLKDADFTKFLNNSEALKPFFTALQAFWSTSGTLEIDELTFSLHEKFFKFLSRLCPSFNTNIPKQQDNNPNHALRSVICPKKVIDCLFDIDPLGLLCYLYETWHPSDHLNTIRDELIPSNILKHKSFTEGDSNKRINDFLKWLTKNTFNGSLKSNERESIIKRFEYESDDDYFEDESAEDSNSSSCTTAFDPLQVILFSTYISSPSTFSRTSTARSSKSRADLLVKTKLTHEQVEGWAIMLERNPKRANVVQDFIIWSKNNEC